MNSSESPSVRGRSASSQADLGVLGGWHYRWIGVDPLLMARCGRMEQILYTTLAMSVVLTVSLAVMYGTISSAIYTTGRTQIRVPNIIVGLFVGLGIYVLERVLLATFTRDVTDHEAETDDRSGWAKAGEYARLALLAGTRILIALIIASLVAEPILLLVYEDDIEVVLQARRDADVDDQITAIQAEFKEEIDNEIPDSPDVLAAMQTISSLKAERDSQDASAAAATASAEASDQLAVCESGGSLTELCRSLLGPDAVLSGEPTCGARCQGHEADAREQRTIAAAANERIRRIDEVDLPAANTALDLSKEQNEASLEVDLDRSDTVNYVAPSDARARQECAITEVQILHNQIATSDPRLPYLFGYCATDPGDEEVKAAGLKVLSDIENKPKVYSGLQPRQEAFEVLTECHDPLGLRSDRIDADEPIYCGVASGKVAAADATGIEARSDSVFDTIRRPLRRVLQFGDSTMSQGAQRLAWVILVLDLLPLFLKLSLSLRRTRPYDSWATLDKYQSVEDMRTAWQFMEAEADADRRVALFEIEEQTRKRCEVITTQPPEPPPGRSPEPPLGPAPIPTPPDPVREPSPDPSAGQGAKVTPPAEPSRREVFGNLAFVVDEERAFEGGCGVLHLAHGANLDTQVLVKAPKGIDDRIGPDLAQAYLEMSQNELGLYETFGPEIGTKLYAVDHPTGRLALEYHPRGSLERYLGINPDSTHINVDFTIDELLTVLEQVIRFDSVLWAGGYTYLDSHAGNYVLCGRESDEGLLKRTPPQKSTESGSLRAIDFGTCTPIGHKPKLAQGRLMPPEHHSYWTPRGNVLDNANPLWDVFQIGRFTGTLLNNGGWGPIVVDTSEAEPIQQLAGLANIWMSPDPLDRVPGVDFGTPVWRLAIADEMTNQLIDIRRRVAELDNGSVPVMTAGDSNNGFRPGERTYQ